MYQGVILLLSLCTESRGEASAEMIMVHFLYICQELYSNF